MTKYQPIWEDGREKTQGLRPCGSRYRAIRQYINEQWEPATRAVNGLTVMDLGASQGYFCRRLVDDWSQIRATAVDTQPGLEPYPGVEIVRAQWSPADIRAHGPWDIILCLSVLHHHANWFEYLAAILGSCKLAFIETAAVTEFLGRESIVWTRGATNELAKIGTIIAETPAMANDKRLRPLWAVEVDDNAQSIMADLIKPVTPIIPRTVSLGPPPDLEPAPMQLQPAYEI